MARFTTTDHAESPGQPAIDAPASQLRSAVDRLEHVYLHLAISKHAQKMLARGLRLEKTVDFAGFDHAKPISPD